MTGEGEGGGRCGVEFVPPRETYSCYLALNWNVVMLATVYIILTLQNILTTSSYVTFSSRLPTPPNNSFMYFLKHNSKSKSRPQRGSNT